MTTNSFRTCFLVLAATIFSQIVIAQKPKKKDPDVQVIDFGDDKKNDDKKTGPYRRPMVLKTSPTAYIFGRQMVELEKEVNDNVSLQFGLGATFPPIWSNYASLIDELTEEGGYSESQQWTIADEPDYYNDQSIRRSGGVGLLASASARLFWESEGLDGMYIAPVFRYSTDRREVQKVVEGLGTIERDINNWQAEHQKNMDIMVHYGYQTLYPKLTAEWFLGAGLRFSKNLRQDVGFNIDGSQNGERNFSEKKFKFDIGVRVGFQL